MPEARGIFACMGSVANFVIGHNYPVDWTQLSSKAIANCTKPLLLGLNWVLRIIVIAARETKQFRILVTPRRPRRAVDNATEFISMVILTRV